MMENIKNGQNGGIELFRAVVEDNVDPKKNGRVRVRIHGVHGASNSDIPTNTLPWAEVMGSTTLGLVSGVGVSDVLRQGTWVWVIFDHGNTQRPIVIGTIAGINGAASDGAGFSDPSKEFPKSGRESEPDFNEIVRGDIANTVIKTKNDNLDTSDAYTEVAQAASTYPQNTVIESTSGHMIELDDSEGNQRVQIIDNAGNYMEMKLTEYIDKAVADKVNLIMGELKEHIVGKVTMFHDNDVEWTIGGNLTINVKGLGGIDINATGGNVNIDATDNINLNNG